MVELRLYLTLENNDNFRMGIFSTLPEAWKEAERLTKISRYDLKDFFTLEGVNETSY